MWTNTRFFIDAEEVEGSHLLGYRHPREIVADESLSVARRRALLAHWLSDRHAVRDVPGLRSISTGASFLRLNISPWSEQARSQVGCRLMVASSAKRRRPPVAPRGRARASTLRTKAAMSLLTASVPWTDAPAGFAGVLFAIRKICGPDGAGTSARTG